MTATIKSYAHDGPWANVAMPTSGGTVNSDPFTVPQKAKSITVFVPALVGTGASVKLQKATPLQDIENASEVWGDVTVFDFTDGSYETLDGMVESTVCVIPTFVCGSGVFRFVASETQAVTPSTIVVKIDF